MPREGTKRNLNIRIIYSYAIEIRYAPGGDEKFHKIISFLKIIHFIEIRYAPGGDEKEF